MNMTGPAKNESVDEPSCEHVCTVYMRIVLWKFIDFTLHTCSPRILVQQGILQNLLHLVQVSNPFKSTSYHHRKFPQPNLNSTALNQLNSSLVPILSSSRNLHKCQTSQR